MKRNLKWFTLIAILLLPALAFSAGNYRPTGSEAVTVDGTAGGVPLTVAKYLTVGTSRVVSDFALIRVETAQIRYTVDATAPTSTVGFPILPYETIVLNRSKS